MCQTRIIWILLVSYVFGACVQQEDGEQAQHMHNTANPATTSLPTGKYRYCFVTNDDTAILELQVTAEGSSGTFMHHYFQQERADGRLENIRFAGDTLFADYYYWSGGMNSVREVVFLVRNGQAREGYGPSEMQGEKQVFTAPGRLTFPGPILSIAACSGNVRSIQ